MLTKEHREKIEYLNQYRYLNAEIDRKIKEMENWSKKIYGVTSILSDLPRGGSRSDAISTGIAEINEIESTINTDIDRLLEIRRDIESRINSVGDLKLREILKCRYLDCKTWETIAYENGYSWQWTHKLHEKALEKIILVDCN